MKYAYVICFIDRTNQSPPAFMHVFVDVENEDDAYDKGWTMPDIQKALDKRFPNQLFNDYVFPVGDSGGDWKNDVGC